MTKVEAKRLKEDLKYGESMTVIHSKTGREYTAIIYDPCIKKPLEGNSIEFHTLVGSLGYGVIPKSFPLSEATNATKWLRKISMENIFLVSPQLEVIEFRKGSIILVDKAVSKGLNHLPKDDTGLRIISTLQEIQEYEY